MHTRYEFRYVNAIAGMFVLAVVALLIGATVMAGRTQRWFESTRPLTILLPEEGSLGLRQGADVMLLGTSVGRIDHMAISNDGRVRAEVTIREDFARFVRQDSRAMVRKRFGVVGDAFLELTRGTGAPLPEDGATITVPSEAADDMIGDTIEQARDEALPALRQFRRSVETLARVMESVERGEGLAGKVLSDPKLAKQVEGLLADTDASVKEVRLILQDVRKSTSALAETTGAVNEEMKQLPELVAETRASLREVQEMVKDMRKATKDLPETMVAVDETVKALPGLVMQTQETLRQVQRLVEAGQRNWFFRGTMEEDMAGTGRIRPEDVAGGR